jgi:signal transduction histidine kinase
MLDEVGLSSALSWYVQGLAERSGLQIALKVSENFGRLPSEMELLIFRLVQESLTNIHRHSGSKTALIRIEREWDIVQVTVEDQGGGMSPERLAEIQSRGTGVGIRGMRERVRHFLGDLVIESSDSGTKVYATLPLKTSPSTHKNNTQQNVA